MKKTVIILHTKLPINQLKVRSFETQLATKIKGGLYATNTGNYRCNTCEINDDNNK